MQAANRVAFKEWAVVCTALAEGRQAIILRKGGIHEGRAGFRVEHREFWLFPTQFHERPEDLTSDAAPLMRQTLADLPPAGTVRIRQFAVVEDVYEINDEAALPRLAGLHIWSPQTVSQRFHYRQPGLFVLVARIYSVSQPIVLPDSDYFAGCRSWVDLPDEQSTAGAAPALTDEQFAAVRREVENAISDRSITER